MADASSRIENGPPERFLARHPIFLANGDLYGYELLFRAGPENLFIHQDGDQATSEVMHSSLNLLDLNAVAGDKKVFINMTRSHLVQLTAELLPPDRVILEILETVEPDEEVLAACRDLKKKGYVLALDDFVLHTPSDEFLGLADIIKVDFLLTQGAGRREIAERFPQIQLLAEKVESYEDVAEAKALGYDYLQGYFFCKPQVLKYRDIPSYKVNYLRFLKDTLNGQETAFAPIYHLSQFLGRGEWQRVAEYAARLQLKEDELWEQHRESLAWANAIFTLGDL